MELMQPFALWQGLLDGRWSIIGRYDREERQVLVARENDSALAKVRALTDRERRIIEEAATGRSNKQVAAEVGLSIGTVSGYLTSALRKMGLRSRAELIVVGGPSKLNMADSVSIDHVATPVQVAVGGRND